MSNKETEPLPENIQHLVDNGKVTYRGCSLKDIDSTRIKVGGKEYKITREKFRELGDIQKMRFAAPSRKG